MARFLFTVWSFAGHINPNVAVAEALRARGHEVAFMSGARAASILAGAGITHFVMEGLDDDTLTRSVFPPDERSSDLTVRALQQAMYDWMVGTLPIQVNNLTTVLDRWHPDVIVTDPTMWATFTVFRETRAIPVVVLSYTTGCMLSGPTVPVWGRGLPSPTTATRKVRNRAERILAPFFARRFRRAIRTLRHQYGLPPFPEAITDYAAHLPLYLVTSVPELDFNRRDLPPHVHYVGRCSWDRPSAAGTPAWIGELPTDRPIIYVTEGTVQNGQPHMLQAAARGLANLPMHVVLSLNHDRDPASVGLADLAPNIQIGWYQPGQGWQSDILGRAAVAITNGGAGSVLAAVAAGIPQIVVPTVWDKPDNAQRMAEAGVGLRLDSETLTPERLRAAVLRVLHYPYFAANARRVATALERAGGPSRAAELLERQAPSALQYAGSGDALSHAEPAFGSVRTRE